MNFSDYIGVAPKELPLLKRIWSWLKRLFTGAPKEVFEEEVKEKEIVKITPQLTILKGIKYDPNFERVDKALRCQEPDRVPLVELGVDEAVKRAFLGKNIEEFHLSNSGNMSFLTIKRCAISPGKKIS